MKRDTRIVLGVTALVPAAILAAATLSTRALALGASESWRLPFRLICHGMAGRCLELWGVPMPVCARCVGVYAGLLAGLAAFAAVPRLGERVARWLAMVAVTPLAVDGLTQLAGLRESTNALRIATGLAAGFAFGLWILAAVERGGESALSSP